MYLFVDHFPRHIVNKLETFPESGMDGWTVAVKTKNGKVFRGVEVGYGFLCGYFVHIFGDTTSWSRLPFRLRDVADIEWEGYRIGNTTKRPEPFHDEWRFANSDEK